MPSQGNIDAARVAAIGLSLEEGAAAPVTAMGTTNTNLFAAFGEFAAVLAAGGVGGRGHPRGLRVEQMAGSGGRGGRSCGGRGRGGRDRGGRSRNYPGRGDCPVLAFAKYLMCHPQILNGECKIFDGSSQYERMNAVLKEIVHSDEHLKNLQSWVFSQSILGLIQFVKVQSPM